MNRAMGPYAWAYWTMVTCNVVVPQLLWIRRVRRSVLLMYPIVLLVNAGMWFERFVIVVTRLFGAMFIAFAVYLRQYRIAFMQVSRELDRYLGLLNTAVLLTSSLSMAFSVAAMARGQTRRALGALAMTLLFGAVFLVVKAREWGFKFSHEIYPQSEAMLERPVGEQVFYGLYFAMTGLHALHSFYIPDFRVKEDVIPGRDTYLWFASERTGVFNVFRAEFCGKDHAKMITKLRVVTKDEYRDWLRGMIMKRFKPLEYQAVIDPQHSAFGPEDLNIDAKTLYATYCASRHGVNGDGSGLPGLARSFLTAQDWKLSPKVTDIYRTLMEGIDGTQMRAYPDFTPWEKMALAHYVRSFHATPPPADTEEDYNALVAAYELDKIQGPKERIPIEAAMDALLREAETKP